VTQPCKLFHFEYQKNIRPGKKEFNHTAFIELSTAHFLEKSQGFSICLSRDICEIKNVTTLWTPCSKTMSFAFLIHFLHIKLHLMFNVNIPKGAERSVLSSYIE
jgi:hypothetical protein